MYKKSIQAGKYQLSYEKKTLVMGILNVTPDSFSDGGRHNRKDLALRHAQELAAAGADIIDIGGESTRPGAEPISESEELERTIPVVEAVAREIDLPISIDTYKSTVARVAVSVGATIINDIWGAKKDPQIAKVAAETKLPIILMHNRRQRDYVSLMQDIKNDLQASIQIAIEQGVTKDQILLDPGIGFAKNLEDNLKVMRHLDEIVAMGYPVLLGTSRKTMIGQVLNVPVNERIEGTAATVALGIAKGCRIVRVHDVKEMKRVAQMMDAMLYGWEDTRG